MSKISRRSFIKGASIATGFAAALPASVFSQVAGANEAIRLGMVGTGGKGSDHINTFLNLPGARIVAICDADRQALDRQKANLAKKNVDVDTYLDVRKLLERRDIDAIVTATPNHWHSLVTVWACQAGKDVYVEKPVSHEIWEGRKMVEAARKYNRIVQPGTQSRSDPALKAAFEYLQQGNLGPIKVARGFCYKRRASIGKVNGPQPTPASLDYNLWAGPAPLVPLRRKNLHYDWHWVWDTGNGDIGNQGIHEMDMSRWALGEKTLPPRVFSLGGRFGYEDDAETPNTQIAFFDYKPAPLIFEVRGLPMSKGEEGEAMDNYKGIRIGVVVECEGGYFAGGGGGGWIFDNDGKKIKQFTGPGGRDHQANFLKAVRSRNPSDLKGDLEECHLSSALCHMANISYRLGQKLKSSEIEERLQGNDVMLEAADRAAQHLQANEVDLEKYLPTCGPMLTMDAENERFAGEFSEMANMLIRRQYREPFVIRDQV